MSGAQQEWFPGRGARAGGPPCKACIMESVPVRPSDPFEDPLWTSAEKTDGYRVPVRSEMRQLA